MRQTSRASLQVEALESRLVPSVSPLPVLSQDVRAQIAQKVLGLQPSELLSAGRRVGTGNHPGVVAIADFTGDGVPDLATLNIGGASVSLLTGDGKGGFPAETSVNVPSRGQQLTAGDFNGDGKIDWAVSNFHDGHEDQPQAGMNAGNGKFQVQDAGFALYEPSGIGSGDFNGDGKADLAVLSQSKRQMTVAFGDGKGGFRVSGVYGTDGSPQTVTVADLNGDGKMDLVEANSCSGGPGSIGVFLNTGNGTFAETRYRAGKGSNQAAAGDVNGDGIVDIAVGNSSDTVVSLFLGKGDGSLGTPTSLPVVGDYGVALGDINGDGTPDLVATSYFTNTMSVLPGKGDGTFLPPLTFATGEAPSSPAIGDLNGDGQPEIVVGHWAGAGVEVFGNVSPVFGMVREGQKTGAMPVPRAEQAVAQVAASPAVSIPAGMHRETRTVTVQETAVETVTHVPSVTLVSRGNGLEFRYKDVASPLLFYIGDPQALHTNGNSAILRTTGREGTAFVPLPVTVNQRWGIITVWNEQKDRAVWQDTKYTAFTNGTFREGPLAPFEGTLPLAQLSWPSQEAVTRDVQKQVDVLVPDLLETKVETVTPTASIRTRDDGRGISITYANMPEGMRFGMPGWAMVELRGSGTTQCLFQADETPYNAQAVLLQGQDRLWCSGEFTFLNGHGGIPQADLSFPELTHTRTTQVWGDGTTTVPSDVRTGDAVVWKELPGGDFARAFVQEAMQEMGLQGGGDAHAVAHLLNPTLIGETQAQDWPLLEAEFLRLSGGKPGMGGMESGLVRRQLSALNQAQELVNQGAAAFQQMVFAVYADVLAQRCNVRFPLAQSAEELWGHIPELVRGGFAGVGQVRTMVWNCFPDLYAMHRRRLGEQVTLTQHQREQAAAIEQKISADAVAQKAAMHSVADRMAALLGMTAAQYGAIVAAAEAAGRDVGAMATEVQAAIAAGKSDLFFAAYGKEGAGEVLGASGGTSNGGTEGGVGGETAPDGFLAQITRAIAAARSMQKTDIFQHATGWYKEGGPLAVDGMTLRTDTVAGTIFAGLYQQAFALPIPQRQMLFAEAEIALGVSAIRLFVASRDNDYPSYFSALKREAERLGFASIFTTGAFSSPLPLQNASPVLFHPPTSQLYTGADMTIAWDITKPASMIHHSRVYLVKGEPGGGDDIDLRGADLPGLSTTLPLRSIAEALGQANSSFQKNVHLMVVTWFTDGTHDKADALVQVGWDGGTGAMAAGETWTTDDLSTVSPTDPNHAHEREILQHLVFPVKGGSGWSASVTSNAHSGAGLYALDLNAEQDEGKEVMIGADGSIESIDLAAGKLTILHALSDGTPWRTTYFHLTHILEQETGIAYEGLEQAYTRLFTQYLHDQGKSETEMTSLLRAFRNIDYAHRAASFADFANLPSVKEEMARVQARLQDTQNALNSLLSQWKSDKKVFGATMTVAAIGNEGASHGTHLHAQVTFGATQIPVDLFHWLAAQKPGIQVEADFKSKNMEMGWDGGANTVVNAAEKIALRRDNITDADGKITGARSIAYAWTKDFDAQKPETWVEVVWVDIECINDQGILEKKPQWVKQSDVAIAKAQQAIQIWINGDWKTMTFLSFPK